MIFVRFDSVSSRCVVAIVSDLRIRIAVFAPVLHHVRRIRDRVLPPSRPARLGQDRRRLFAAAAVTRDHAPGVGVALEDADRTAGIVRDREEVSLSDRAEVCARFSVVVVLPCRALLIASANPTVADVRSVSRFQRDLVESSESGSATSHVFQAIRSISAAVGSARVQLADSALRFDAKSSGETPPMAVMGGTSLYYVQRTHRPLRSGRRRSHKPV